MKKVVDDPRLMRRVCDLYYNKEVSRQDIGKELGLSRPTVNRLLASARENGIVRIEIPDLESVRYWDLEQRLVHTLGLKEAVVVDPDGDLTAALGKAAAGYLQYVIRDGNVVGLSMGSTLLQTVLHMNVPKARDAVFVPLVGGMGRLRMELHSNQITERMYRIYGGEFYPIHAPARVAGKAVRTELLREASIASAFRLMKQLDVAVVGIGCPGEQSVLMATGLFAPEEFLRLKEREAAGEICLQFFDRNGNPSLYEENRQVIGIDIVRLRKVPCSVGVAGGLEKLDAIRGAVRGGFINVLITDVECAQALAGPANDKDLTL